MRSALIVLCCGALVAGCASAPAGGRTAAGSSLRAVGELHDPGLSEPSGLVASRRLPGVLWTHGDSGNGARLFAVDRSGRVLARYEVDGARNVDWEDIAVDEAGNLYVGDIGNNFSARRDLVVYRVPEPASLVPRGRLRADRALRYRYADQHAYPGLFDWNFDAEALFWMDGSLWILTKHRVGRGTRLYALPVEDAAGCATLAPVATYAIDDCAGAPRVLGACERAPGGFSLMGTVTAADYHAASGTLAVLAQSSVSLFGRTGDPAQPFAPQRTIPLAGHALGQAESLAFDGLDLLLGNEAGSLFLLPGAATAPPDITGTPISR